MTGSIVQIPGVDWHILVARADESLYRTTQYFSLFVLAGILVALFSGMIASVYLARKMANRFDALIGHAQDIVKGERSGEWPTFTIKEFNELSENLQLMAHRLQDSETLYRTLFEQLPEGIILWSIPELAPVQFNSAAHSLLGYTREEFSSLTVLDLESIQDEKDLAAMQETIRREGTASFETVHRTKSGDLRSMIITLRMVEIAGQPMILALHRDITNQKLAEDSLRETQELFTLFMKYSPIYTFIKQIEGDKSRVVQISDNFISMIGRHAQDMRGRRLPVVSA